jgi:hypothetical protein
MKYGKCDWFSLHRMRNNSFLHAKCSILFLCKWRHGSIPEDSIAFHNLPDPSSRTLTLDSSHPVTEISSRNLPGGEARPMLKADNLTSICKTNVKKIWELRCLINLWASTACCKAKENSYLLYSLRTVGLLYHIRLILLRISAEHAVSWSFRSASHSLPTNPLFSSPIFDASQCDLVTV